MQIIEEPVDSGAGVGHWGLVADRTGHIYCADEFQHQLLKWAPGDTLPTRFARRGSALGELLYPCGLCVRDDVLWVADSWNHRIQGFDAHGRSVAAFGGLGTDDAGLQVPLDVKVDGGGALWVADAYNHRLLRYPAPGDPPDLVYTGGHPDSPSIWLTPDTSRHEGLVFYYPGRLMVHGDTLYVVDSRHVCRIGTHTVDALPLPPTSAGIHPIGAGPYHVDVYAPYTHQGFRFNFSSHTVTRLFQAPREVATLGQVDHRDRVLVTGPLHLATVDAATEVGRAALFERPEPPEGPSSIEAAAVASDGDPCDHLPRLFADVARFFDLVDELSGDPVCFLGKGAEGTASDQNPAAGLSGRFLTDHGRIRVAYFEALLSQFNRFNTQLASHLVARVAASTPAERMTFLVAMSMHFLRTSAAVAERREALLRRMGRKLRDEATPAQWLQAADGALFHLDRFQYALFSLTLHLRGMCARAHVLEEVRAHAPGGFFVAAAPQQFGAFVLHLINCARRLDESGICLSDDSGRAAENYGEALKGAVLSGLRAAAAKTADARDLQRLRQTAHGHILETAQLYGDAALLYRAYGFPPDLMNFLLNDLWSDGSLDAPSFIARLEACGLGEVREVRSAVAAYYCQYPDPSLGLEMMAGLVRELEGEYSPRALQNSEVYASLYVPAVVQWGYYTGREDLAQGLTLLDRISGHSDRADTRAKLFLEHGRFEEAGLACMEGDPSSWPLGITRGLIHLCAGEFEAAARCFGEPVPGTPAHMAALYHASVLRTARDFDGAAALLEKLWADPPQTLRYHLGILYRMWGKPRRALACFQEQMTYGNFADNTFQMMICLRKLGFRQAYETALGTLPPHAFMRWDGRVLLPGSRELGEALDAMADLEQAPPPGPSHPSFTAHARMIMGQLAIPMYFTYQRHSLVPALPRYPAENDVGG